MSKLLCSNNQLGIGIPDGCSIGATIVNRYLHVNIEDNYREKAILQNDISNAFNETSHSLIEKGLALICPDLIHVFRFIFIVIILCLFAIIVMLGDYSLARCRGMPYL